MNDKYEMPLHYGLHEHELLAWGILPKGFLPQSDAFGMEHEAIEKQIIYT